MPTSKDIGRSSGFNIRAELEYAQFTTEAAIAASTTLIAASGHSLASTQSMIAATYGAIERLRQTLPISTAIVSPQVLT